MKRHYITQHHILPRSRGGDMRNNILYVDEDFHIAYHKLFVNLTPSEVLLYLQEVWFTKGRFVKPKVWRDK